jgi:tetratricopeptide (TPR) repeat protein
MRALMTRPSHPSTLLAVAFLAVLPPVAFARAEPGTQLENVELKTLAGGKEKLLSSKVKANIFVFFRTGQERSVDALKQMAQCEQELAGKSIHWAAVVSGSEPVDEVRAVVSATGIRMPVLLDEGDVLYDRLGVRLHPMVGIADGALKLQALEPYRQIDYCDVIKTRLKVLLGEATLADLEKAINPEPSPLPGSDPMKKAMRDVNMARRLYELGLHEKAIKQAQKALEVAPVGQAFVVMGEAYAKLGKCAESTKALDQALKLDPSNKDVAPARTLCGKK